MKDETISNVVAIPHDQITLENLKGALSTRMYLGMDKGIEIHEVAKYIKDLVKGAIKYEREQNARN